MKFANKSFLVSRYSSSSHDVSSKQHVAYPSSATDNKILRSYLGQPSPYTHAHQLENLDHVTQGITKSEYDERRQKFMFTLRQETKNNTSKNVAILPASSVVYSAPDVPYPFRQESNFFYLSGFCEPDSFLVIHDDTPNGRLRSLLFVAPKDPQRWVVIKCCVFPLFLPMYQSKTLAKQM